MFVSFKNYYTPALVLLMLFFLGVTGNSQSDTLSGSLKSVIVKAYENNRRLKEVPAAINHLSRSSLGMFGTNSITGAVNTLPGAKLEERSPGSYRLNIRGSSLRSPFGVRNVKVYYNDIPITDPGGHTYLNQFGVYNFASVNIIKGPGSSVYGAGTGGVMLIESLLENEQPAITAEYSAGSYGYQHVYAAITNQSDNYTGKISFQHQESDGYRNHSALKRDVFAWNGRFNLKGEQTLTATFLYGDLFYETPGALTKTEYDANPRMARPGSAAFPGAVTNRTSITQKQFIAGASYAAKINNTLENTTILYGMFTDLRNPTIQNYGHNTEPHAGIRTVFKAVTKAADYDLNFLLGTEWQQGFTSVSIFKNSAGRADTLRTFDEINNRQGLVFAQAEAALHLWTFTAGASFNYLRINFERFSPASLGKQLKSFKNQVAPRFAILRKFGSVNLYTSVSRGFSPPATAELLPTGGAVNLDLNAENGVNYDLGIKGTITENLYVDVNVFYFGLNNTIVQRRTAAGGDYFINAGKTRQKGIETYLYYTVGKSAAGLTNWNIWVSHTLHDFHYAAFKQLANDFSGNRMPGEPVHNISTGVLFNNRKSLQGVLSYQYTGRVGLNDAGTAYAKPFHLAAIKLGYNALLGKRLRCTFSAGADNLLNQKYSLGNDINGFGGRYYNAATGRNYYASITLNILGKKLPVY